MRIWIKTEADEPASSYHCDVCDFGCRPPVKHAAGVSFCSSCWANLLSPGRWPHVTGWELPPEVAREVLNAHVIDRYHQESAWADLRMHTNRAAMLDGVAFFYPVAHFLLVVWVARDAMLNPHPLDAFGLVMLGGWIGAFTVALWNKHTATNDRSNSETEESL